MQEIIKVGNIVGKGKSQGGSTYLATGISPTLLSGMSHGNVMPFIVDVKEISEDAWNKINQQSIRNSGL